MQFFKYIFRQLKTRLDITPEKVDEATVIDNVRRAVMFRGVNLWILIFAVIIASVGLNIDSTPIIIGAMLISPLMGPIIGTGLAVGINDMELMKRSIRNLFVAALFAVFAAMIYFFISPLNEAQSELLARTSPTLYDVLIAFVGGIAGFLALSTQGNHIQVIIGVAISTALLPPLCTVGFGLATGQWLYALGAFYLFFINSVFIAIATFLSARLMRFSQKEFADKEHERKVRRMLIGLSLLALLPSFYLTYRIVGNTLYEENASDFVVSELNFPGTQLVSKQIEPRQRTIIAIIAGKYIPQQFIEQAKEKLPQYHLAGTRLLVMQGAGRDSTMLSS
ncbi:MAG: TIGR00341 family protein, partial [Bacteroidaceae bacterium]|nr:TIGR00341 family protein [Bacteroidaceae bacterium]